MVRRQGTQQRRVNALGVSQSSSARSRQAASGPLSTSLPSMQLATNLIFDGVLRLLPPRLRQRDALLCRHGGDGVLACSFLNQLADAGLSATNLLSNLELIETFEMQIPSELSLFLNGKFAHKNILSDQ